MPVVMGVPAAWRWVVAIDLFSAAVVLGGIYLGLLPRVWLFVLFNNALTALWTWRRGGKIAAQRGGSHILVAVQTVLLVCTATRMWLNNQGECMKSNKRFKVLIFLVVLVVFGCFATAISG